MPSEKHQKQAREIIGQREATLNYETLTAAIAAALESAYAEGHAEGKRDAATRCAEIAAVRSCNGVTCGHDGCTEGRRIVKIIRAEFGIGIEEEPK